MKNILVKSMVLSMLIVVSNTFGAVNVQDLQDKEKELYAILTEYWIDKEGDVHVGNRDAKSLQFAFSESLMNRMTVDQLKSSMNAAIARFTKNQKNAFINAVDPYLKDLDKVKKDLKHEHDAVDSAAAKLAKLLNKSPQDILKLGDENISNLIKSKIQDGAKKVLAYEDLAILKRSRAAFGIKTVDAPLRNIQSVDNNSDDDEKVKPSNGGKKTAAAQAIANSNFKISSMVGFLGEATKYSTCQSRHFDILIDSEGLQFITEAR